MQTQKERPKSVETLDSDWTLKGDVAVAKRGGQLEFNVCHSLLLKVGQFDSAAKFLKGHDTASGFKLDFDGLVNFVGQFRVMRGFGEDSLEHIQQLRFIRLFCFFLHHSNGPLLCRIFRQSAMLDIVGTEVLNVY